MHNTYKGIYMKFRNSDDNGYIQNVVYEDIVINNPSQWAIFIGPAQQSDSDNLCAAHPCSICWPTLPKAQCNAPITGHYENITLRNITINDSKMSPGVIMANESTPIINLTLQDVIFNNPGTSPWGDDYYKCEHVKDIHILGNTWPIPTCN
jgi:hypothetical protein